MELFVFYLRGHMIVSAFSQELKKEVSLLLDSLCMLNEEMDALSFHQVSNKIGSSARKKSASLAVSGLEQGQKSQVAEHFEKISKKAKAVIQSLQETIEITESSEAKAECKKKFSYLANHLNKSLIKIKGVVHRTPDVFKEDVALHFQAARNRLEKVLTKNRVNVLENLENLKKLQSILHEKFLKQPIEISRVADWFEQFSSDFTEDLLQCMPEDFVLTYTALLHALQEMVPIEMLDFLPSYAKSYLQILNSRDSNANKAKQIEELLSERFRGVGLACFVNTNRVPLKDVFGVQKSSFSSMLPHLKFVDLRGNYTDKDVDFEIELIKRCSHVSFLFIENSKIECLPDLPKCLYLQCSNCLNLKSLPDLPNCKILNCSLCVSLRLIGSLRSCEQLNCSGCVLLSSLQDLPNCLILDCSTCISLKQISSLPKGEKINCCRCRSLQALPSLLHCRRLDYRGCESLAKPPQVPFFTTVYYDGDFSQLEVDIDLLKIDPKKYLFNLGKDYLLQEKPFPMVRYCKEGQLQEDQDIGNVRRNFVASLFEHLKKGTLLPLSQEKSSGIWPVMDGELETNANLCTVARLLALCYAQTSGFKTGEIFDSNLFKVIKLLGWDGNLEEAQIQALLLLEGLPSEAAEFVFETNNLLNKDEEVLVKFSYFLHPEGIKENLEAFFLVPENRQSLRHEILQRAGECKRVLAASLMASEMKKLMGPISWANFCSEDLASCLKKIQGI